MEVLTEPQKGTCLHEQAELVQLQGAVRIQVCDLQRPPPKLLLEVLRQTTATRLATEP